MRKEILFVGIGGQGLVTSSILLGEAAMNKGLNSVQAQTYGSASRGGLARGDTVISDSEINFPRVLNADIGVFLDQEKYDKYKDMVKEDGLIIHDTELVEVDPNGRKSKGMEFITTAEEIGSKMAANVVVLGSLVDKLDFLTVESVDKILENKFSDETLEVNKKAFRRGRDLNRD